MGDLGLRTPPVVSPESAGTSPQTAAAWARRWLRPLLVTAWAAALVISSIDRGLPLDRESQALWILTGLLAAMVGTSRGGWRVLRDWLPLLVLLFVYDRTRGIADTLGMPLHVTEPLNADLAMFGVLPTEWLQDRLYDRGDVQWWDIAVAVVYFSHFLVVWVVAFVLYLRSRRRWLQFVTRLLALTFAGLVTYVLYPAAPPWLAARMGEAPTVRRISIRGWEEIGLQGAARLVEIGQVSVNAVAAVPSLHAAFSLLVVVFFWRSVRRAWGRVLLAAYPLAMAFTLVYCGEHYVIDVLLGWLYVAVVFVVVGYVERRWLKRPTDEHEVALAQRDLSSRSTTP